MSKKVAVLFSGGLDSTYLVWKNLKDGNSVIPIYIEIENNKDKTILEKNRIKLLWKEFDKEFNDKNDYSHSRIEPIEYAIKIGIDANEGSIYFKQVPIWIFSVVFLQGMNVDEVQIGYVCNDDAISYLEDIQNIYKAYQPISKPMKPLVFPIIKMKKFEMAEELPEQYRKYIFSCEGARIVGSVDAEFIEYKPCCECVPCKTIIANEYYKISGFSDTYKKAINEHYINELHHAGYKIFDNDGKSCADLWKSLEVKREPYQLEINFNCCDEIEYVEPESKTEFNG